MEKQILFGTYSIPSDEFSSSTYSAPGILPKKELAKINFVTENEKHERISSFDKKLKKALEYDPKGKGED